MTLLSDCSLISGQQNRHFLVWISECWASLIRLLLFDVWMNGIFLLPRIYEHSSLVNVLHVVPPSFAWLWKDHSCYLIELIIWNHCLIFHCAGLYFWCKATQKSCTHTFVTGRWVAYKSGSLFNRSLLSLCLNYILEVTLRCSSCSCLSHSPTESCEASEVMLNIYLQANTGCYTH